MSVKEPVTGPHRPAPPPAKGTRPRDRHALIVSAATDLFHRYGYAEVTMTMIAERVNVRPSALYRHFANKHSLLAESIRVSLAPTSELLADGAELSRPDLFAQMARLAVAHREVGVLWQREARALPPEEFAAVRAALRDLADLLVARLRTDRAGLGPDAADQLAWSMLAALASLSFHEPAAAPDVLEDMLVDLLDRIFSVEIPHTHADPPNGTAALEMQTRRELLLASASRLFAAQGYAAVTVDAIGEAAGIAGPSVYNHFASKQDLLVAAVNRGNEWLWMELTRAFGEASDENDALRRLLDSYLVLAVERGELGNVLAGDLSYLPEVDQTRARQSQQDYVREWVALLCSAQPGTDRVAARVRVQAAFMIMTNTTQTPHLLKAPGSLGLLRAVAFSVLGLGQSVGDSAQDRASSMPEPHGVRAQ